MNTDRLHWATFGVACLALLVALGVPAHAASLARASVGNVHLKPNAVTSSKVKDRSLLAKDFKRGQLPRGAPGVRGPKGDPGSFSETRVITGNFLEASCPAGWWLTGGGFRSRPDIHTSTSIDDFEVDASYPDGNTWRIEAREHYRNINPDGSWSAAEFRYLPTAFAVCAR